MNIILSLSSIYIYIYKTIILHNTDHQNLILLRIITLKKFVRIKKVKIKEKKLSAEEEVKIMLEEGKSIKEIAKTRGIKGETVIDHIEKIRSKDPKFNIYNLRDSIPKNRFKEIYNAFHKIGVSEGETYRLAPVKELLGPKYSYEDIRLVRLFL